VSTESRRLSRRRRGPDRRLVPYRNRLERVDKTLLKRQLFNVVKVAVSLGILTYLVIHTVQKYPDSVHQLQSEPKNWLLLIAAWLIVSAAVMTTFFRWYLLVRVLALPFSLRDAFRLGFVGYFFNLISLGTVGGDLFKAMFLAREQPGHRTEAVATVVVDRVVGVYGLLLVASAAIAFSDVSKLSDSVSKLCKGTLAITAFATVVLLLLLRFGTQDKLVGRLYQVRHIGPFLERLGAAAQTYRLQKRVLAQALLLTLGVHCLGAVAFYLIAEGLPGERPNLATHFFIVPLGMVAGAIPLPMAALGAFEGVMQFLYLQTGGGVAKGLVVALVYRLITLLVGTVGIVFYVRTRQDLNQALEESRRLRENK